MITQEDYTFITQLDNSDPEQRAELLRSKPYLVSSKTCLTARAIQRRITAL